MIECRNKRCYQTLSWKGGFFTSPSSKIRIFHVAEVTFAHLMRSKTVVQCKLFKGRMVKTVAKWQFCRRPVNRHAIREGRMLTLTSVLKVRSGQLATSNRHNPGLTSYTRRATTQRAGRFTGAALQDARRRKERTYPELIGSRRCRLVVLGIETGGRWSEEASMLFQTTGRSQSTTSTTAFANSPSNSPHLPMDRVPPRNIAKLSTLSLLFSVLLSSVLEAWL